MTKFQLDPLSPNGISKAPNTQGYNPYFAGGPGKVSLLDSVNGKHGAVQITAGSNVTIDNTAKDIIKISSSGGAGGGSLDDLDDVVITAPSNGQVLKYDGSEWINDTGVGGGVDEAFVIAMAVAL